jgi:DNA topoisomerase-1
MSSELNDRAAVSSAVVAAAGFVYVSDAMAGIRRVRTADGFVYTLADKRHLTDEAELKRIASLATPPAYEDVWICPNPRGHLQATGREARGRKQYRYHPKWRLFRDGAKFERMPAFGEALPRLRRRLRRDLAQKACQREKVLAVIVSLLDVTRVRIGNAEYARDNDSYGLTTLRNRHVQFVRDGRLLFRFAARVAPSRRSPSMTGGLPVWFVTAMSYRASACSNMLTRLVSAIQSTPIRSTCI